MRYRSPSRYEPAGGPVDRAVAKALVAGEAAFWTSARVWTEWTVFGRGMGGFLRKLFHVVLRRRLAVLEGNFDVPFYLSQIADRRRRGAAARAPLLHYTLIGWRELRAPIPRFDPGFYWRSDPRLSASTDPLHRYVNAGRASARPVNEVELAQGGQPLSWRAGKPTVLTLHHALGGGSSRFLDLYEREIWASGRNVLRLRAVAGAPTLAVLEDRGAAGDPSTIVFDLAQERGRLIEFARSRSVDMLLVNHFIGRPPEMKEWVTDICRSLGCPFEVVLHDFYALCPRIDMVTGEGRFCDAAPTTACVPCVARHGSDVIDVDPANWRQTALAFLGCADRIVVPSEDLARRMRPYLSGPISIWEPERDLELPPERKPCVGANEALRVVTLGALNVSKGVRVVRALAAQAASSAAPMTLTVLGPATEPSALAKLGVRVAGAYVDEDLDRLIAESDPHAVFLPAIWPETWSFALSAALRHGLPVVAFDIGAPAERLRRLGRGHILPLELSTQPDALLTAFCALRKQWGGR